MVGAEACVRFGHLPAHDVETMYTSLHTCSLVSRYTEEFLLRLDELRVHLNKGLLNMLQLHIEAVRNTLAEDSVASLNESIEGMDVEAFSWPDPSGIKNPIDHQRNDVLLFQGERFLFAELHRAFPVGGGTWRE